MVQDQRIERWLEIEGVAWEYRADLPLGSFDRERSERNQARLGPTPVDENLVLEYAIAFQEGAAFPALIAAPGPDGLVLISGNHRLAAARIAGVERLDAYVVSADALTVARLTRTANRIEGRRPSPEELIVQGKWLVRYQKMSRKDAAAAVGVPVRRLEEELLREETLARLGPVRQRAEQVLPKTALVRLGSLENDRVLQRLTEVAVEARLGSGRALEDVIKSVTRYRTEAEQLAAVATVAARPDVAERRAETRAGRAAPARLPKRALRRCLSEIEHILQANPTLADLGVATDEEARQLRREWQGIQARMEVVLHAHYANDLRGTPALV